MIGMSEKTISFGDTQSAAVEVCMACLRSGVTVSLSEWARLDHLSRQVLLPVYQYVEAERRLKDAEAILDPIEATVDLDGGKTKRRLLLHIAVEHAAVNRQRMAV